MQELPRVPNLDSLPFDVGAGYMVYVEEHDRPFIFDGFKWNAEGDQPGAWIQHYPTAQPVENTGFEHCPDCVGVQVLTSIPPCIKYECKTCGGGVERMPDLTKVEVGPVGPNPVIEDSVCLEAHRLINGERQDDYSHPYVNFGDTADLFSAYLGIPISRTDVANLMILVKLARAKRNYKRDNYVDIAGYAGTAEKVHEREQTMAAVATKE